VMTKGVGTNTTTRAAVVDMPGGPLTEKERALLARLEAIADEGILSFRRVGNVLAMICDARLYRETHVTFEEYLKERWDIGRARGYQMMKAAATVGALSTIVDKPLPANEAQARELGRAPDDQRQDLWNKAVDTAPNGTPTAAHVRKVVEAEVRPRSAREVLQSSKSVEHYTPSCYVEAARAVLGRIDLDPASCREANRVVKATRIHTIKDDGLSRRWSGNVYLNPPGGRDKHHRSVAAKWVARLLEEYEDGDVEAAVLEVFNARPCEKWFTPLWQYPICFTDHRVDHWGPGSTGNPVHGAAFVYFGIGVAAFVEHFGQFGRCVIPHGQLSEVV